MTNNAHKPLTTRKPSGKHLLADTWNAARCIFSVPSNHDCISKQQQRRPFISRFRAKAWLAFLLLLPLLPVTQAAADIGIIVALNSSYTSLRNRSDVTDVKTIAGREFTRARLANKAVVLVRSPMGKVNNAITAQLLLSHYPIDFVVNLSPAGAVDESLNTGDVVIANGLNQHDFGTIKPYGFIRQQVPEHIDWVPSDFSQTNGSLLHRTRPWSNTSPHQNKIHIGPIVSGDQFISSPKKRRWLQKKFGSTAVDMSAAAIGQVCQANDKTLLIMRVITDYADLSARASFGPWHESYKTDIDLAGFIENVIAL